MISPLSQTYFLNLFERVLPNSYFRPIKESGPGFEIYQAFSKIGERLSLAVFVLDQGLYVITATGGVRATTGVEFFRPNLTTGVFTQKAGTIVSTTTQGREFVLETDLVFGALDLTLPATVRALGYGPDWNVKGPVVAADGSILEGEIGLVTFPVQDPSFQEPNISVRQTSDGVGGVCGYLDQLGADRGIVRRPSEGDPSYRARIRALPDTVSPAAMRRALDTLFLPLGVSYSFIETFEGDFQTCWNAPNATFPNSDFDPATFVYNDPRPSVPFRNRWLGEGTFRGCFLVIVPAFTPFSEKGLVWNDPGILATDFVNPLGRRAASAYNLPTANLVPYGGVWNGDDQGIQSFYLGLFDLLQKIKAAGVTALLEIEGS